MIRCGDSNGEDRMRAWSNALLSGIPILLALLVACNQFRVRSAFDPGADFTRLRTYAWLPLDQGEPEDQRFLDRCQRMTLR